ncbi:MAG: glycosyltransferase family 39 protein [Burkholderiaceae bacterium]|nr:glycosyltransferase family 39 protein [Burkholderiaceae bacterium]
MRPFIVTELQAGKLPRWGLLLVCALYAVPGFVARDPWRKLDAAGFGIALTMMRGDSGDWLMPNIAGQPVVSEGPLPFWLAAAFGRAAQVLFGEHAAVQAAVLATLALGLVLVWYALYALARRQGVQPSDPFGASASRTDYGRAIADTGLLVLMATFGLLLRMHETTAEPAQFAWIALFLFGCAQALDRPAIGGALAGAAIAATLLTRGVGHAGALLVVLVALPLASRSFRLIGRRMLVFAVGCAVVLALPWPLALLRSLPGREHLAGWLDWNLQALSGPTVDALGYFAQTAPWFYWPAWPVALWAAYRWRGRWSEPAVALPALATLALLLRALLAPNGAEGWLLPATVPLAMLAAVGVPTLKRGIVNLIDWFAVTSFTLFSIVIWAYWIALMTGFPPRMAFRMRQMAPGFLPEGVFGEVVLGIAATAAWLLLVRWRVSRQPPMIWRPMVLSCGGVVLAWFLLMTLWLPVFNERNTYRDLSGEVRGAFDANDAKAGDCIAADSIERAARASFYYFANLPFGKPGARCRWLLVQDDGPMARTEPDPRPGWDLLWEGRRRSDRDERFLLYRHEAN